MNSQESLKYQIIRKYLASKIFRSEAARLLNVSERTIARYAKKISSLGPHGVKNGNFGKTPNSAKKYSHDLKQRVVNLYVESYFDFNLKHFWEVLSREHKIEIKYQTLWSWFKDLKLIKHPRRKRPRKHVYRNRLPQEGLLLQMDGCHHKFNGKDEWCLITAIDDATSNIPYAEFFSNGESTLNCMKVLSRIIEAKGVPKAIYTDKAGWAGGGKRSDFSQFKRACEKLGIQLIFADTPEAKGRIERSFRTIQDRLVPELRLNKITDLKEANSYLKNQFLENYWNKEKVVNPQDPSSAYSPLDPWLDMSQILCVEETRVIGRDQTISWQGIRYVIRDGVHSLANYMAIFRTDLLGKTRVFVLEREVSMVKVKPSQRVLESFKIVPESTKKLDIPFALWGEMHNLILDVGNAVKRHKVTGKPLKIERINRRRAN